MANSQLQVILKEQNVAAENARQLLAAFGAPFDEAGAILTGYKTIEVTDEEQFDLMAEARDKRLTLKRIRVDVEKKRKELKENSLRTGRAIDSVAKFVEQTIKPAEEYLEQQEKFGELRAAERAAKLKAERIEKLSKYTDDLSLYNLDALSDEQFDSLLATLKAQKDAELLAAKKAEEQRLAEVEAEKKRQAEIEAENVRLKAEAEAREKAEAERQAEQAKKDAAAKAEADRIQKEADDKVAAEKAKAEALEQEKLDREAAEAKAKADAEEVKRQALLAPDKEKLLTLAAQLEEFTLPAVSSKDAQAVLTQVEGLLAKVTTYIRGNAGRLA